ncbi:hypothetical protein K491DRAFT_712522 [Lophiostoma macrostomum CBS 122681]|uniref:Chitin synthesis regulation, resistance to congo red-domain-containing protein n=1 Tax=Lophiostoma macrostomum CBS 122681 TaxID=1314788 RepID=A0A6A6THI8_9PLEO|nr:hypothetical protein K491DRAFT_712522 [Lophiostoma macrostomum CBS 122681]
MARCGYDRYGNYVCRNSVWSDWVRWVVLVVVVLFFFGLFIVCSCITARRRRRAGRQPFYGTGWAARPGANNAQPYYNNNQYSAPAPPYSAQPQQNSHYGANQGYYGQQQNGVELQQPQPAYTHGGENVYQPPAGPPPGKA